MEKYSLLYVDDEESNLRIFKDTFRRKFKVYTALSAKEGIDILDNNRIDLVLSDQRMPEMTGVEFLKYSLQKYPEPNRILITGYSDTDAIESAINKAHIFQYVQKPWEEEKLTLIIEEALQIYHLEQVNRRQKEELIKMQEKLIQAKEKAEESNRLKTEFIRNMSHEIRTPMNGILGFSEFLNIHDLDEQKRKRYINIIQNSGKQLLQIIDDILEISRLETKQVKVFENKVCLNDFCWTLFSIFEPKAKEKKINLYFKKELTDSQSTILIDETKLNKILSNLIENALKFTSEGFIEFGYNVKTHGHASQQDENYHSSQLQIYVRDTGIGIKAENQKSIFERFSQENKELSENVGGLGLGLSIAKENTELLGGKISLESEKGKGATFFVTLPYKPVALNIPDEDSLPDKQTDAVKQTILIAEDEEINYLFLETLIEKKMRLSYNILHAKNGKEALDFCRWNKNIDIVLMDLKMPVMSGFEATKQIKKIRPDLPVIAQTAYSTQEDRKKAIASGCTDFISKPIGEKTLSLILKDYLTSD